MITKGKQGFSKRVVAMLMTILMVWSLIPANVYVTKADEGEYTFSIVDVDNNTIDDATITVYTANGVAEENKITSVTGITGENSGEYVVTYEGIESGCLYTVSKEGYVTAEGSLTEETTVNVTLEKEETTNPPEVTAIVINGVVTDAESIEMPGVEVVLSTEGKEDVTVTTAEDGSYSFEAEADVTYTISVTYDGYKPYTSEEFSSVTDVEHNIALTQKSSIGFDFEVSEIELVIGKSTTEANAFVDRDALAQYLNQYSASITYSSSDETIATVDENTGIVTAVAIGEVTITATIEGNDEILTSTATYTVKVKDKTEAELIFENNIADGSAVTKTYGDASFSIVAVLNNIDSDVTITYVSSANDVAEVDENGTVTLKKPGEATITASFAGNEDYKAAEITYVLTVEKAQQTDFAFKYEFEAVEDEDVNKIEVTYKEDGTITVATKDGIGNVSYASSEDTIATVDENGKVTFLKAGTVTITATAVGNDYYAPLEISYVLEIAKASQQIEFESEFGYIVNGSGKKDGLPAVNEVGDAFGTGSITYTIKEGSDEGVLTIDENTGELTFTLQTGTVTIVATKEADDCYEEASAEYTLTVGAWDPLESADAEDFYSITNTIINGWYVSISEESATVELVAADGYVLTTEEPANTQGWSNTLTYSNLEQGTNNTLSFYIKDEATNYVSVLYTIENVKIDTVAPEASIEESTVTTWEKILAFFGLTEEKKPTFTINYSDTTSGVANVYYYIGAGEDGIMSKEALEKLADDEWKEYTERLVLTEEGYKVLYAKVVDEAGNCTYVSTQGLVFDGTAPTVNLSVLDEAVVTDKGNYYVGAADGTVSIRVVAKDSEPYSGIKSITYRIICDGEETKESTLLYEFTEEDPDMDKLVSEWDSSTSSNSNISVSVEANNSNRVVVEVTVTDNAGNSVTEEISLQICKETPTISVSYVDDVNAKETINNVAYYDVYRTAKVVITSRDDVFSQDNVVFSGVDSSAIRWEEENEANTHVAYITFNNNTEYSFTVEYADILGVKAEKYTSETFVIDKNLPTGTITIGKSSWDEFLEKITFGLYSTTEVTVSVTGTDETSPIKSIEYVLAEDGKTYSKADLNGITTWSELSGDSFKISNDKTFVVYVKITDYAGNYDYISSNGYIVDSTDSVISFNTLIEANANDYFNKDVPIEIVVQDTAIDTIIYWITCNGVVTKEETTLLDFDLEDPSYDELVKEFKETVTVIATENDSANVELHVKAVDMAGNEIQNSIKLKISTEIPTIAVTYENDPVITGVHFGINHYQSARRAKIVITSRDDIFVKDNVKIVVDAVDAYETDVENAYSIEWATSTTEGEHIVYVNFNADANYQITVDYADANEVKAEQYKESFVIDHVSPNAEVSIDKNFWAELLETITFRLWKNTEVEVNAKATDATSEIKSIEYYVQDINFKDGFADKPLTEDELDKVSWTEYNAFTVGGNKAFIVYVKATDYAGNYTYIGSNGYVADSTKSNITLETTTQANDNGYYNSDVLVDITVTDMLENINSYSGIKTVTYWITCDGEISQEKIERVVNKVENPKDEELVYEYTEQVKIEASKNNSDNVVLHVEVVDNAGNTQSAQLPVKIDVTQPSIALKYNEAEEKVVIEERGYYDTERVATVVITERLTAFDPVAATAGIKIVANDLYGNEIDVVPTISTWVSVDNEENPDLATHTATITFSADAYYEIEKISYTDKAGNVNTAVTSVASEYPYMFAIDKTETSLKLTIDGEKDIYNSDVNVILKADDYATTAGIKSVTYWVTNGDAETQREVLYLYGASDTVQNQYYSGTLVIDSIKNNGCDIKVYVEVIDMMGHKVEQEMALDIDIDAPEITVSFDNNNVIKTVENKGYFDADRVATIVVTERAAHFNKDDMLKNIIVTAVDVKGKEVTGSHAISFVKSEGDIHTFKVAFYGDANYTLQVSYTDAAGLVCANDDIEYLEGTQTPNKFTVDETKPTAKITVGELGVWEKLLQTITFGLWSPASVDIVIASDDATSPIESVQYYKTSTFTALTKQELDAVTEWVDYEKFTVGADDIFVVYVKVVDYAGQIQYISSNGIILDKTKPVFETLEPEITVTPQQPVNGIYSSNVKVDVNVIDPKDSTTNAYAGLREIRYEVYNMGTKTQEGTLYTFDKTNPTQSELLANWSTTNSSSVGYGKEIVVDASKNNSNDVAIKVIASDNAGNQSEKTVAIKIDTTNPTIEISYDNNEGNTSFADGTYFDANRVATIKITERNFDANDVKITITNSDGVSPTVSSWKTTNGTGNGDNAVHTATITYSADGDYTFDISYNDKAGNVSEETDYGNSLAPTEFTIDKTLPVINVSYDNNDVLNGNYYRADRVATITIKEHNFDVSGVDAKILATNSNKEVTALVIGAWSKSGDTYTAQVSYTADAYYTFDISFNDKAGNEAADFVEQNFYVDKTRPQVSIKGIVDSSANNADVISFEIKATDTNFDIFEPVLTAVIMGENGYVTKEIELPNPTQIGNGKMYTIENIDTDGIYRITCTVIDKAGNAYSEVTLEKSDGQDYIAELSSSDTLVSFSVNRDGSTFDLNEATSEIVENYYVYEVSEDIVIIEVNADEITEHKVTLNGTTLVEGEDYEITPDGGSGEWRKYIYSIHKEKFIEEGEYFIVVSSTDGAKNNAYSDVKDTKVSFVVDKTAPVVTISGLEKGSYQADSEHVVTLIPTDDGGALSSLTIRVTNKAGEVTYNRTYTGNEISEALAAENGVITFKIGTDDSGIQQVEIICSDSTMKADGTNNVYSETFEVMVASSEWALVWANATLRYSIIAGSAAAVVLITCIIIWIARRKKEKDKTIVR